MKFCLGPPGGPNVERQPPEAVTLRMAIVLTYSNPAATALIIPASPRIVGVIIKPGEIADIRGQIEIPYTYASYDWRPSLAYDDAPAPNKNFETIAPRAYAEGRLAGAKINAVVRADTLPANAIYRSLLGQTVQISLEISHELLSDKQIALFERRWKSIGDLWTGRAKTDAITVQVPERPPFGDCSREYSID